MDSSRNSLLYDETAKHAKNLPRKIDYKAEMQNLVRANVFVFMIKSFIKM